MCVRISTPCCLLTAANGWSICNRLMDFIGATLGTRLHSHFKGLGPSQNPWLGSIVQLRCTWHTQRYCHHNCRWQVTELLLGYDVDPNINTVGDGGWDVEHAIECYWGRWWWWFVSTERPWRPSASWLWILHRCQVHQLRSYGARAFDLDLEVPAGKVIEHGNGKTSINGCVWWETHWWLNRNIALSDLITKRKW